MKLVTSNQMRDIEARVFASGISQPALMERAGGAVAIALAERLGGARARRVLILVGPGNNGGDGLVAARHLHDEGADVRVYLLADRPAADANLAALTDRDVEIVELDEAGDVAVLVRDLRRADAVVDAVLGIGTQRPLSGTLAAVFDVLRSRRCPFFAIDVPTGVNADTGAVDPYAADADVTFALGFSKLGLHMLPGSLNAGEVTVLDIGIEEVAQALDGAIGVEIMTSDWVRSVLPQRPLISNKGTFGRVLVVAGSPMYTGAATLACLGALRAGAGLVTLACREPVRAAVAAHLAEVTFLPLPGDPDEPDAETVSHVAAALSAYDALLIGPGLGMALGTQELVRQLVTAPEASDLPVVIDADGLNALARQLNWHESMVCKAVLTPHPGELARLTRSTTPDVQADRLGVARRCVETWGQTLVLKGAQTVIAAPEPPVRLSPFANALLATAGTGDVLAGTIAGLLAQGVEAPVAAGLGVYLHGAAAELYADEYGMSGLLASELGRGIALAAAALRRSGA